jgi:hypothetical protein
MAFSVAERHWDRDDKLRMTDGRQQILISTAAASHQGIT